MRGWVLAYEDSTDNPDVYRRSDHTMQRIERKEWIVFVIVIA